MQCSVTLGPVIDTDRKQKGEREKDPILLGHCLHSFLFCTPIQNTGIVLRDAQITLKLGIGINLQ